MVRRATARLSLVETSLRQCIRPLMEPRAPGQDEFRCVSVLTSRPHSRGKSRHGSLKGKPPLVPSGVATRSRVKPRLRPKRVTDTNGSASEFIPWTRRAERPVGSSRSISALQIRPVGYTDLFLLLLRYLCETLRMKEMGDS